MNWNEFKQVLRSVDERVTENACERGRRWVPEREASRTATTRPGAGPKSPKTALAR